MKQLGENFHKYKNNPCMNHFIAYVIHLACNFWSETSIELLQVAVLNGYTSPELKNERAFLIWYCRLMRFMEMQKQIAKSTGFVYLFEAYSKHDPTISAFKIGCSADPDKRVINVFGSKQPFVEVRVIHTIKTDDMTKLETRLHSQYANKRTDGEWFNLTKADVEQIKSLKGVTYYMDIADDAGEFKQHEDIVAMLKAA